MGKLRLRKTTIADLEYVLGAEADEENRQFIIPWTRERHLEAIAPHFPEGMIAHPDIAHLIVQTDTPVGFVILAGLTDPNQVIEFRRIVITDKGKGYGRGAIALVQKLAFETYNAHRLWLDVKVQNHRAQAVYEAAGFIKEGILRECLKTEDGYDSLHIMSMLRQEYHYP